MLITQDFEEGNFIINSYHDFKDSCWNTHAN
jgi:hypothetical protein